MATQDFLRCYWGFEERSTAFFALGRIKNTGKPTAIIVTSGTAVGEVLPAVMEAYYSGLPLLVISADRPKRFRGSGAPQSCEQIGIFGIYTPFIEDLEALDASSLQSWNQQGPAQVNLCFEEPKDLPGIPLEKRTCLVPAQTFNDHSESLQKFIDSAQYPWVIVGELPVDERDSVEEFLLRLNAPTILEPASGLAASKPLGALKIVRRDSILENAAQCNYPIDSVLRIGGIPTLRLWRDLENLKGSIPVFSLSHLPFSGLSFGKVHQASMSSLLRGFNFSKRFAPIKWLGSERDYEQKLTSLYEQFPRAEQTLMHELSKKMPSKTRLYLGNSLPIRYWDQYASNHFDELTVAVNRGLNGIDGQLSTALGYAQQHQHNWIILGDLTTLYDLSAPWFLEQLLETNVQIVVFNNSGGKIFAPMFKNPAFQNKHQIQFKSFAEMWKLDYALWEQIPDEVVSPKSRIIEIVPDADQTRAFREIK